MTSDLYENLDKLSNSDIYPFHMPGHKRRDVRSLLCEEDIGKAKADKKGFYLEKYDITEIEGFDNLHKPNGILKEINERLAALYGIKNVKVIVGGSTTGILSSIYALVKPGDTILIGRNCHMSVYHAALLSHVKVRFLYPEKTGRISSESLEKEFLKNKNIKAVVITDPTYEGMKSDICKISEIVHKYGGFLIVDAAHGAHLIKRFIDNTEEKNLLNIKFPYHPINEGADIAVSSLHKTLPAITGAAEILISDKLPQEKLKKIDDAIDIFETSSPSYLIMASIANCIDFLEKKGKYTYRKYKERLFNFYKDARDLKYLKILDIEARDPSKIMIMTGGALSGYELMHIMRNEYKIELEEASENYCLALSTILDTEEGFERLKYALFELNKRFEVEKEAKNFSLLPDFEVLDGKNEGPKANDKNTYKGIREGIDFSRYYFGNKEERILSDSEGETAAGFIEIYPPGVPFIFPGSKLTRNMISYICEQKHKGAEILGLKNDDSVEVLKE